MNRVNDFNQCDLEFRLKGNSNVGGDKDHSVRVTKVIHLKRREGYICACTVVIRNNFNKIPYGIDVN